MIFVNDTTEWTKKIGTCPRKNVPIKKLNHKDTPDRTSRDKQVERNGGNFLEIFFIFR